MAKEGEIMTIKEFKALFTEDMGVNGFYLDKVRIVFRSPLQLWNSDTNEEVDFDTIDDMLDFEVDGKPIRESIEGMEYLVAGWLEGSGGSGSGSNKPFKFGHAGRGNGPDESETMLPAYANVRIETKTLEGAMKEFRERFKNANREWAYEVDPQGFVHQYVKGNATSVPIWGTNKNNMILHNHPSGGAFSDSDLISTSMSNERGIVASGKKGDYVFEKNGGHFRPTEFIKAVKSATMMGKDYDDAVDKWLTKNQRKYGYRYKFVKGS